MGMNPIILQEIYGIKEKSYKFPINLRHACPCEVRVANCRGGVSTWYTGFVFRYIVPLGFNDQGQAVNLYDIGM